MNVGDVLEPLEATAHPSSMKTMAALLRDPNMIHLDPAVSESVGLGARVVNQGPISMGWVHTMLLRSAGDGGRLLACRLRFLGPVFGDERVRAGGEVTHAEPTAVECVVWLDVLRPDGPERALSGTARLSLPDGTR